MAFHRKLRSIAAITVWLAAPAVAQDTGFIYGTVTLEDDTEVTGSLRWDGEEVAWIHHFNGTKAEPADISFLSDRDQDTIIDRQPGPQMNFNGHIVEFIKVFGGGELEPQDFAVEFGALSELELTGGDRLIMTLRDGSRIEADGGSNDISTGTDIEVQVNEGTLRSLDWRDIEKVRFHAPTGPVARFPQHLFGTVDTELGQFTGFVEWDQDERWPSEKLDSEMDGREEEVEFASIRRIQKDGDGSLVTLTDGVEKFMTGTNDVDSDNRGIVVTIPDMGRVELEWEIFKAVDFLPLPEGLPAYQDYAGMAEMQGTVATDSGTHRGKLMFNVDHRLAVESLVGRNKGIHYTLPFHLIQRIEPQDAGSSRVTMKNGRDFELRAFDDVTEKNDGVVIWTGAKEPVYVPWSEVKSVSF
ncbi:MAG: hypothetical protein QNJ40_21375 [Xanthomonadales bacterium]|nr:hypothetical protein [Xanthomonadales bacterium]